MGLVEEIIRSSGLLSDVSDNGQYVFAHRSIQEYLAAEEIQKSDYGNDFLLDHAVHTEWRQVILFYATALEQRHVNSFLPMLSQRNPELAAYCLAGAKASDTIACAVLDALDPIKGADLAALAAANMSPRLSVQEIAIDRLEKALARSDSPLSAISGEIDGFLPLLSSLAGTNAAQIAALVPQVTDQIPNDPRLVEPLWRCLAAPGIENLPASYAIVRRLLVLAIGK